ncbi:aldehyde dehydrogenase, dimeric NADP-preferring [Gamsiella multidivaricata]|uniref:aldehyde dehydrogenase, dimeric NADP-preferring n=1 Tax=Gamsiella multidivaricata TaxID=101098 RepID=UPI0022208594|nr:aldehyde dehydrogenase, dimeric NADP-preferring [Gamsiella multidivaricata]KAG0365684.1 aldehyde dehydrogenase 3, member A2 [Gamsiella multidivaricata]KAI7830269.1 aldehyde dehydrogenase, dimeric NADP-preferring [Gamsiella multidivaricata]
MSVEHTPISSIPKIVADMRASFLTHRTQSLDFRKEQLRALVRGATECTDELVAAIQSDLGRTKDFEVPSFIKATNSTIDNLEAYTQNQSAKGLKEGDDCYVRLAPLGTVLIIGTWNFPINLVLAPLVGAIAAGNTCVVKPSEVAPHSAVALTKLLTKYMDPGVVTVVNGGSDETTELLKERFDHIFYTGSTPIGKVIMAAAAKHLTPVTLELGGKSPTIITEQTNLPKAAQRIAYWKTLNCGQVCLSVDYVICPKHLQEELIKNIIGVWRHLFGPDFKASPNYPKIINKRQHERLEKLQKAVKEQNKVVFGGKSDPETLFMEPTIVTDVSLQDDIMKDEIFGPILPFIACDDLSGAIDIINKQEHPLCLNIFTENKEEIERVFRETRSGSYNVNDVAAVYTNHSLPFGGVGHSGMGSYHGKFSVETFSHKRSVTVRSQAHL